MDEARYSSAREQHKARAKRQFASLRSGARIALAAVALAALLRTIVLEPFNIPSESMLPTLLTGDYLFVAKWPYGIGRYSLPIGPMPLDGRIGGSPPERGDVVVFKTPHDNRTDFIKRVIGVPGDRVRMLGGQIELNGVLVPKVRAADFTMPMPVGGDCQAAVGQPDFARRVDGALVCRYPRFVETLGRRRYFVLDQVADDVRDTTPLVTVPAGHYFVEGDNRDDSADSRLRVAEGGVGMVPAENLIGRADVIFFSTSGTARLSRPASWLGALRLNRVGERL